MSVKKVTRKELVEVFSGVGCPTAREWSDEKLLEKVNEKGKLAALRDGQPVPGPCQGLYFELTSHVESGGTVEMEGQTTAKAPTAPATPDKAKAKKAVQAKAPAGQPARAEKVKIDKAVKKSLKNGKAAPPKSRIKGDEDERGPGVIWGIVHFLATKASKSNPKTKKEVVDFLVKQFPGRGRDSLDNTTSSQIPNRIEKEKGIRVSRDGKGAFWIEAKDMPKNATAKVVKK